MKISIWKYVKLDAGWRYCAAVEENNRYKPDWVHMNSHTEHHPEGNYYLLRDRKWIKVGATVSEATAALKKQQALDLAVEHGLVAQPEEKAPTTISGAVDAYMKEYEVGKDAKTIRQMRTTLEAFKATVKRKHNLAD